MTIGTTNLKREVIEAEEVEVKVEMAVGVTATWVVVADPAALPAVHPAVVRRICPIMD
jgi:hypothetical protein